MRLRTWSLSLTSVRDRAFCHPVGSQKNWMNTEDYQNQYITPASCKFVQRVKWSQGDPQLSPPSEGTCLLLKTCQSPRSGWGMIVGIQSLLLVQRLELLLNDTVLGHSHVSWHWVPGRRAQHLTINFSSSGSCRELWGHSSASSSPNQTNSESSARYFKLIVGHPPLLGEVGAQYQSLVTYRLSRGKTRIPFDRTYDNFSDNIRRQIIKIIYNTLPFFCN